MEPKAIPTRIIETKSGAGETLHCTWEVQLYNNINDTVILATDVDLLISGIKASKTAYNNHLRAKTIERMAQLGYTITGSDVIIL